MKKFIDHDGLFLPQPGWSHPAIEQYREALEGQLDTAITIPATTATLLFFVRSQAIAEDMSGGCWAWTVWVDQFGRALAEDDLEAVGS